MCVSGGSQIIYVSIFMYIVELKADAVISVVRMFSCILLPVQTTHYLYVFLLFFMLLIAFIQVNQ